MEKIALTIIGICFIGVGICNLIIFIRQLKRNKNRTFKRTFDL